MDQATILITILGMGAVTYLPRLLPVLLLSSRKLPPLVAAWLRYVPVAVLSAMLLPSLAVNDGALDFSSSNLFFVGRRPNIPGCLENAQPFWISDRGDGCGCTGSLPGVLKTIADQFCCCCNAFREAVQGESRGSQLFCIGSNN